MVLHVQMASTLQLRHAFEGGPTIKSRSMIECLVQVSCLLPVLLARSLKALRVRVHPVAHTVEEKDVSSRSILPFRVVHGEAVLLARRLMLHGDAKWIVTSIHCISLEFLILLT